MKVFNNKLATLLAALLVLALVLTGCSGDSGSSQSTTPEGGQESGEEVEGEIVPEGEGGVLRVGMECAYAPFNWTQTSDANGGVAIDSLSWAGGYDVEIAKLVAQGLGMELEIVKTDWDGLIPSLTSGRIDVIIAGMSDNPERRQTIDFTNSYYSSDIVVVVKADSEFASAQSINDFTGAKITGQLGTLHYDFIDQMEGVDKQTAMADFTTMIIAVTSGKIDGYVSERPGAISAVASNPELTFVDFSEENGFSVSEEDVSIAIGVAKNSPLTEQINEVLAGIDTATREKLMEDAVLNQPQ